jgi:hypothetical protein
MDWFLYVQNAEFCTRKKQSIANIHMHTHTHTHTHKNFDLIVKERTRYTCTQMQ